MDLRFGLSSEATDYLDLCASMRDISRTRLVERLIKTICRDQLVLSVLDDDGKAIPVLAGEPKRRAHHRKRETIL